MYMLFITLVMDLAGIQPFAQFLSRQKHLDMHPLSSNTVILNSLSQHILQITRRLEYGICMGPLNRLKHE